MSDEQKEAIEDYTGEYSAGSYNNVNKYLRTGEGDELTKKKAELVTSAIENCSLGSEGFCFRGISADAFGDKKLSAAIKKLKTGLGKGKIADATACIEQLGKLKGMVIQDKALMSTSSTYNENYGNRDFVLRINAKADSKACDIYSLSKYGGKATTLFGGPSVANTEYEVLFAANTKMKITKVSVTDKGVFLDCDILK